MQSFIVLRVGAVELHWHPDDDLNALLDKARFAQTVLASQAAAAEQAPQRPAGPSRNAQPVDEGNPGERPRTTRSGALTPEQAEARFWRRYGEIVGGRDWQQVQRYLGRLLRKPTTVDEWIAVAEEVRDRARQAA